jgi:hypothetical protein
MLYIGISAKYLEAAGCELIVLWLGAAYGIRIYIWVVNDHDVFMSMKYVHFFS